MKKVILSVSLFFAAFCLFAQTFREARIFVPAVTGTGSNNDNVFFQRQLTYEIALHDHRLVKDQRNSDFVMKGTVELFSTGERNTEGAGAPSNPVPRISNDPGSRPLSNDTEQANNAPSTSGESGAPPGAENNGGFDKYPEYILTVELINSLTGEIIGKQHLIYYQTDAAVGDLVSIIVYNMLTGVPYIEIVNDVRNRWFYITIDALWVTTFDTESIKPANFGAGLSVEYQMFNFLSLDLGLRVIQHLSAFSGTGAVTSGMRLEIPLALNLVFKPRNNFMLEPYIGASFNFLLENMSQAPSVLFLAGFQFCIKAGPGLFVLDPRFSTGFSNPAFAKLPIEQRMAVQIGIGYKFGFFTKNIKLRDN